MRGKSPDRHALAFQSTLAAAVWTLAAFMSSSVEND